MFYDQTAIPNVLDSESQHLSQSQTGGGGQKICGKGSFGLPGVGNFVLIQQASSFFKGKNAFLPWCLS